MDLANWIEYKRVEMISKRQAYDALMLAGVCPLCAVKKEMQKICDDPNCYTTCCRECFARLDRFIMNIEGQIYGDADDDSDYDDDDAEADCFYEDSCGHVNNQCIHCKAKTLYFE
jgi:hypothetical protein